jgi:signal transduction histidine kinase/DNA-binding response OmpR family regulator
MALSSNGPRVDPKADEIFVGDSEMASLMRAVDWSATSLGPVSRWPQSLRAVVRLMLTSRFAMWLGWGEELTFFYNDAYGAMTLGAKHPWALGKPSSSVWREIWPEVKPRIDTVLESGVATWDERLLLFLERSGYAEETYHTFSYSPVFDDDGVIRGNFCVVTEETERVIGERRLALLKELASQLASTNTATEVRDALARSLRSDDRDMPFSLTYLGGEQGAPLALASHTGLTSEHRALRESAWPLTEVIETASAVVVPLDANEAWPCGSWSHAPSHALAIPIAQQGQARPVGVFIAGINPHRPLDETYRGFLTLLVAQLAAGLSNARAYEQERRRAESLAELDRAKTAFFSNVSHELRTPLTLMLSPLEELRRSAELPSVAREELDLVQRNGQRLLRLVNTLLDFSRIEAGRAQARYEPTDLAGYTADLVSVFSSATERAGLALKVDCPPLGAVYVDRSMWEKIVLNLLSNAFKYTFEGSIEVRLRARDGHVDLSVRDTGTGIPEHEMPRLFERFHRVEGAKGRTNEGTGIGLALVSELVRLHAGSIQAESRPAHGSMFTVAIPLGREHLPPEHVHDGALAESRPAGAKAYVDEALHWLPGVKSGPEPSAELATPAPTGRRVLLADDNADMRDYIRRMLAPLWEIETVSNGREALEAIRRKRPALLIADVMMPELDGFGLLSTIRSDAQLRDLPVVMLSARAGEEARLEGLEAGADEYLVKPFTSRELIAHVEAQLMRARVREVERALERRLTSVFEHAPVAVAILRGPDHVYELANPSYMALIGHRPVVGQALRDALPELVDQGIEALLDGVFRTGEPFQSHSLSVTLNRGVNGEPEQCVFDFVYHPMRDHEGAVEGIAVVAYDVTELAVARKQAEVASLAKDEFLAMLGHELRNPLAPIMTALQLIKERRDGTADREHRIIERQVNHLVALLDDLLDVSRITQGKLQLHKQSIELHEIVAKAIETASPLLEKQRHALQLDVPREGLAVHADPARMAQVFGNLLINAAKYTPEGGVIAISGTADNGDAIIRVTDNGIGIAPDMLPRVFEMFVQERQALARTQGGLGLGLAIVNSLVKLHDGAVSAHSEGPSKGTEITVRLPLTRLERSSAPAPAAHVRRAAAIKRDKRVLIVDDNEDVALMVSELLHTWGYDTRFAHDAMSAIALAERFEPHVAVLDIGLPVIDGYELAKRFAQHPKLARTRLVAVTGYGQEQDRKLAHAAGFAAHLVKPVDPERLREVIEQDEVEVLRPIG